MIMDYCVNTTPEELERRSSVTGVLLMRFCPACLSKIWGFCGSLTSHPDSFCRNLYALYSMNNCPCCDSPLPPDIYSFADLEPRNNSEEYEMRRFEKAVMLKELGVINFTQKTKKYTWDEILAANSMADLPQVLEERIYPQGNIRTPEGVAITGFIEPYQRGITIWQHGSKFSEISFFVDKNYEDSIKRKSAERMEQTIRKYEEEASLQLSQKYSLQNIEQLKTFLSHLVDTEKSIYILTERLKELYYAVYIPEKTVFRNKHLALSSVKKEVLEAESDLQKLKCDDPTAGISKDQISLPIIPMPVAPNMPEEPTYGTPGLFNKKRVLAANNELKAKYEKECTAYEEAQKKYEQEMVAYNEKLAQQQKERDQKYEELLQNAKAKHLEDIQKQEALYKEKKDALTSLQDNESTAPTKETIILQYVQNEIRQAEELLKKLICTRTQMYNSGVIFGKYHSFVAVASFYEYLCAGRCESLEGTNGAYSLYENEVRMNMVISQLSEVIGQLEKIRQNQFVIYSAINEANKQLFSLNHSMATMNEIMENVDAKLADIEQNTGVIAYNSAVTAFYSKKNAELTNALGFLTALS